MAVTNEIIRPPIIIQNTRNKQSFDTYAFTIDIVPLVLEKTCFAGHTFEYKWKTKPKAQSGKRKADSRNQISKKEKKAHLHVKLGPSIGVDGA